jgi:hypothetical protein
MWLAVFALVCLSTCHGQAAADLPYREVVPIRSTFAGKTRVAGWGQLPFAGPVQQIEASTYGGFVLLTDDAILLATHDASDTGLKFGNVTVLNSSNKTLPLTLAGAQLVTSSTGTLVGIVTSDSAWALDCSLQHPSRQPSAAGGLVCISPDGCNAAAPFGRVHGVAPTDGGEAWWIASASGLVRATGVSTRQPGRNNITLEHKLATSSSNAIVTVAAFAGDVTAASVQEPVTSQSPAAAVAGALVAAASNEKLWVFDAATGALDRWEWVTDVEKVRVTNHPGATHCRIDD